MLTLFGGEPLIRGVDLYDRNPIDTAYWISQAVKFGIVKLSEGDQIQPGARARVEALHSIGAEVGGYSYDFLPREDQSLAARVFVDQLRAVGADDLYPSVDLESLCNAHNAACVAPAVGLARCEQFTDAIEQLVGVECTVYTGAGFWGLFKAAGRDSWLTQRRLWQADYNVPLLAPWTPAHAPAAVIPGWAPSVFQFRATGPDGRPLDCNITTASWLERMRWLRKAPSGPTTAEVLAGQDLAGLCEQTRLDDQAAHEARVSAEEDAETR